MFDLTGKTALVTGATGGIGGAIAQALHAQGATVAISGTRREVLDTLAGKFGDRVHVLPCNLSDDAEVEALVPAAEKAMGQVDILVANAGITRDNLFVQLRDQDWDEVIKVNLTATFRLARAATRLMMRKRYGRIIAITSVVGVTGNPGQGNYTASKAGLIGMIKTLGAEIKQVTEALDQVLGALGKVARNVGTTGRVFSAENGAITDAETRIAALSGELGDVDRGAQGRGELEVRRRRARAQHQARRGGAARRRGPEGAGRARPPAPHAARQPQVAGAPAEDVSQVGRGQRARGRVVPARGDAGRASP